VWANPIAMLLGFVSVEAMVEYSFQTIGVQIQNRPLGGVIHMTHWRVGESPLLDVQETHRVPSASSSADLQSAHAPTESTQAG
jgi:hypothetical protein